MTFKIQIHKFQNKTKNVNDVCSPKTDEVMKDANSWIADGMRSNTTTTLQLRIYQNHCS